MNLLAKLHLDEEFHPGVSETYVQILQLRPLYPKGSRVLYVTQLQRIEIHVLIE